MNDTFHWLDVERIAEELADAHQGAQPFSVSFSELRAMVQELEGFEEQEDHSVNERILEAIQLAWHKELEDLDDNESD
ncbi:MAG: Fe-S cluster assembly protein IscX [Planctomycetota bacterium]